MRSTKGIAPCVSGRSSAVAKPAVAAAKAVRVRGSGRITVKASIPAASAPLIARSGWSARTSAASETPIVPTQLRADAKLIVKTGRRIRLGWTTMPPKRTQRVAPSTAVPTVKLARSRMASPRHIAPALIRHGCLDRTATAASPIPNAAEFIKR